MPIQITNTLSGKKEPFVSLTPGQVGMYVCGPTVYNFTHIGNARPCVFFDVVKRFLELSGYKVRWVMNFTDVDDKIINRAREEKVSCSEITQKYTAEFLKDCDSLGIRRPDIAPKVTESIPEIISLVAELIKNGSAYVIEGGEVLFSVRKFAGYGKLSKKNIDDLQSGARVQLDEKKKDPLDFSLWKPQKAEDEPAWDSPWGKGRPGWHIECSAMALRFLGETFDLHGGGMDLIHPHHENEIAQTEAFTHKPFVKYWLHTNMLSFNSEKMSKSLGNVFLTRDFIQKHTAETLRYLLLSAHYRSVIDFSEKHVRECHAALHRVYSALAKSEELVSKSPSGKSTPTSEETALLTQVREFAGNWKEAMEDDFNTAKVMGQVFEYVRAMNTYLYRPGFKPNETSVSIAKGFLENIKALSHVINVFGENSSEYLGKLRGAVLKENGMQEQEVLDAIASRTLARQNKDFASADSIRKDLLTKGIELRDKGTHTEWDIVIVGEETT